MSGWAWNVGHVPLERSLHRGRVIMCNDNDLSWWDMTSIQVTFWVSVPSVKSCYQCITYGHVISNTADVLKRVSGRKCQIRDIFRRWLIVTGRRCQPAIRVRCQTFRTLFICSILCLPFRPLSVLLRQQRLLTGFEGGEKTAAIVAVCQHKWFWVVTRMKCVTRIR